MATIRTFVAVLLDDACRAALDAEVLRLRRVARDVAWVAPDNVHLTIKVLGGVEEERLGTVMTALDRVAGERRAFDLAIRGLGAFPTPTRARVIWAGVAEGAEPLTEVAGTVDRALVALGFEPEGRSFSPHATLGRVRAPKRQPALEAALGDAADRTFGRVRAGHLSLMRSDLSPRGARYTELHRSPFAGGGV